MKRWESCTERFEKILRINGWCTCFFVVRYCEFMDDIWLGQCLQMLSAVEECKGGGTSHESDQ